jgi:hypothetical protein
MDILAHARTQLSQIVVPTVAEYYISVQLLVDEDVDSGGCVLVLLSSLSPFGA